MDETLSLLPRKWVPFIIIVPFLVDKELEYDRSTMEVKCPPKCTACIDACPTGAILEPLKMNPFRCIAFNTFTTQDGRTGGISSYIPPDIREKMGGWIHGCDLCQEVCPRNQKKLKATLPPDEFLMKIAKGFDLVKLLKLPDEFFAKPFTRLSTTTSAIRSISGEMPPCHGKQRRLFLCAGSGRIHGRSRRNGPESCGLGFGEDRRKSGKAHSRNEPCPGNRAIDEKGDRSGLGRRLTKPEMTGPTARKALERRP